MLYVLEIRILNFYPQWIQTNHGMERSEIGVIWSEECSGFSVE